MATGNNKPKIILFTLLAVPEQPGTSVEEDENAAYELRATDIHSRCGWTLFEGWKAKGHVRKVVLRGREACKDGKILVEPGSGRNVWA